VGPWIFELFPDVPKPRRGSPVESFLAHKAARADIQLCIREARECLALRPRPAVRRDQETRCLTSASVRARWSEVGDRVDAEIWSDLGEPMGLELRTPLLNSLQIVAAELLRPRKGLFFHAASVQVHGGTSVLVPGVAGAGKTTFASGGWVQKRFNDEHSLVDLRQEHPVLWGVPFSGRQKLPPAAGSAPLDLILFLEHGSAGDRASLTEVPESEALQGLLRSLICFDAHPEVFMLNLDHLTQILRSVPAFRLRYHPDSGDNIVGLLGKFLRAA